jgi:hypothetical protein
MYATRTEIEALIPASALVDALKDPGTGDETPGLLDQILVAADLAVDEILGAVVAVPIAAPPAIVRRASVVFTLEILWLRKGVSGNPNPWSDQATRLRNALGDIATGGRPLGTTSGAGTPGGFPVQSFDPRPNSAFAAGI